MRHSVRWMLILSLFASPAFATEADGTIQAIQQLEREVHMSAERAYGQRRAIGSEQILALDAREDALRKALSMQPAEQSVAARKLAQVQALIGNLHIYNELQARGQTAPLPYSDLPRGRQMLLDANSAGSSCQHPLPLELKQAIELDLMPTADHHGSVWVRVSADPARQYALSSLGSRGDVRIDWYRDCGADPSQTIDDSYGLQELAAVPDVRWIAHISSNDRYAPVTTRLEVILQSAIAGRVLAQPANVPANDTTVYVFRSPDNYSTTSANVINGTYVATVYSAGNYQLRTGATSYANVSNLLHVAYPNIPCSDAQGYALSQCGPGTPTILSVADGQYMGDIDFRLESGRALTVAVTDELTGAPIRAAAVNVTTQTQSFAYLNTDSSGIARIVGLRSGISYYIVAGATGYRAEAYDNIPCPPSGCPTGAGTPITFAESGPYSGTVSIALTPRQRLQVNVRSLSDQTIRVELLYPSGQVARTATVSSSYNTMWTPAYFEDVEAGNYYLRAAYQSASPWRLYPDLDCTSDCASLLVQATLIQVRPETTLPEYYLEPTPYPSVRGKVLDSATSAPLQSNTVYLISLGDGSYRYTYTNAMGEYAFNYSRPGSYIIAAISPTHEDAAYPNAPCQSAGFGPPICPNATPVEIAIGTTETFDLHLSRAGSVSGTIKIDGVDFPNYNMPSFELRRVSDGTRLSGRLSITPPNYLIADIPAGQYYLVAPSTILAHGAVWPDQACVSCSATIGTPISINGDALTNYNFNLRLARGVKGRVTNASTGGPLPGILVDIWEVGSGGTRYAQSQLSQADGSFTVPYVGYEGNLRVSTSANSAFVDEVYNNIPCPYGPAYFGLCDANLGVLLPVAIGIDNAGITFRLTPRDTDALFQDGWD